MENDKNEIVRPDVDSENYDDKNDLARKWFEATGIPIIYKCDTETKIASLYQAYNTLAPEMKRYSDLHSLELFNMNNEQHYSLLIKPENVDNSIDEKNEDEKEQDNNDSIHSVSRELHEATFSNPAYRNFDYDSFEKIVKQKTDGNNIYLVFSYSSSRFGNFIKSLSQDPFSHVSLSFDSSLNTMLSFVMSGKKMAKSKSSKEGLVWENPLLDFTTQTKFEIYSIKIGNIKINKMLEFIKDIVNKGSNYNDLFLVKNILLRRLNIRSGNEPYSLVCSQFVAMAFNYIGSGLMSEKAANGSIISKKPEFASPYDLIKLSSKKMVKFEDEGNLFEYFLSKNIGILPDGMLYTPPDKEMEVVNLKPFTMMVV